MKYKKYALPAYLIYIASYLVIVAISVSINGWGLNLEALIEIVQFMVLPLPICIFIGFTFWLFKRANMLAYSAASMVFVSPVGVVINLFAAYLLWWSTTNA